ncbi:phosphocholine cytidylyltransferase family protein [bacterium]|nr:phosphocholine cytidylyltransferase family protein [bacterium]
MKAVIVAAGRGSRLSENTGGTPKTLLPFGGETILARIIRNLCAAGITDLTVVVGYQKEHLVDYLASTDDFGLEIRTVFNPDWHKGNGISVLTAQEAVGDGPFILSMSDHIVSVPALRSMIGHPDTKNLLLTDPRTGEVFDIDDATKVETRGRAIVNIGKEIRTYNAIDCGIFRLNDRFFGAMRAALERGSDSISAAINQLIADDDMNAVPIGPGDFWIDIDTGEAYEHALSHFSEQS